jgi:cytochrome c biogenesis protein
VASDRRSSDREDSREDIARENAALDAAGADDSADVEPGASAETDPRRPSDHFDSPVVPVTNPRLNFVGYLRFFWRQLTSMRTALFLLLLVAFAAVPGSLVPQQTSDPNGVIQYKAANPGWSKVLDFLGVFNTYSSVWFSAIYILLFISLIGCIIPRTMHHINALRTPPPKTPARLDRLPGFLQTEDAAASETEVADGVAAARTVLRGSGYRVRLFDGDSASAERGYLRETGNLVFHIALVGILISVGLGGGFIWTGQKVVPVGQSFANTLSDYDSISPGRWFSPDSLEPYKLTVTKFVPVYERKNLAAYGDVIDYTAYVRASEPGKKTFNTTIKVNSPLRIGDTDVYLLSNGLAPVVTVRNPAGKIVYTQPVPFLPQDTNLTSEGVIKVPDGLAKQIGMIGFFYPTECDTSTKGACGLAPASVDPSLTNPVLTLQVYTGDLGLNSGRPVNAYALNTDHLKLIAGRGSDTAGLTLRPGQTVKLPDGLGTIELNRVVRYVGLDIHHDPTQLWVLTFAILVFLGLITGLFVPRRRIWIKVIRRGETAHFEYAGLARGDDPRLDEAVADIARRHSQLLGLNMKP